MGVMDCFSGVIHLIPFNEPPSAEETTKAFIKKKKKKKKKKTLFRPHDLPERYIQSDGSSQFTTENYDLNLWKKKKTWDSIRNYHY